MIKITTTTLAFLALSLTGCGGSDSNDPVVPTPVAADFTLTSSSYKEGEAIPVQNSCSSADMSPQYSWTDAPEGTTSFALVMDDEVLPCGTGDNACRHWAVFNIPATITNLIENVVVTTPLTEGLTYNNKTDYAGPCPPIEHTYKTTVYALGTGMAIVPAGEALTRSQFSTNYKDWILDQATITGTFKP